MLFIVQLRESILGNSSSKICGKTHRYNFPAAITQD